MDFAVIWVFGLSFGAVSSVAAFIAGKRRASLPRQRRKGLFALAAFLAFGTAIPVALTGLFFFVFGATVYCEDYGGPCAPTWWAPVGLSLFGVVLGLLYLAAKGVREYRRIR